MFCINKLLMLQKKKGQGINTVIVIPLCNSLISGTRSILLNNFRNLVIFCMTVDIDMLLLLWNCFNILNRCAIYIDECLAGAVLIHFFIFSNK